MKILFIAFKNLQAMLKSKTLTFCFLISGITISLLTFVIMTGTVKNNINIAVNKVNTSNTFSILNIDSSKLNLAQDFIEKNKSKLKNILYINTSLRKNPLVGWNGNLTQNDWMVFEEGGNFNSTTANEIMVSYGLYLGANSTDNENMYLFAENKYSIVGLINYAGNEVFRGIDSEYTRLYPPKNTQNHVHAETGNIQNEEIDYSRQIEIISVDNFLANKYVPNIIRLHFDGSTRKDYKFIYAELVEIFGSTSIIKPIDANIYYAPELIRQMIYAIVLIAISVANIISSFLFLCKIRKRNFYVFYLVGFSRLANCMIIIAEWIFIFTISFFVFLLLTFLLNPIFELFSIRLLLSSEFEALSIYLVGLFATVMMIIPTARQTSIGR